MVAHALSGALRTARVDEERRRRLQAIEGFVAAGRKLVADLDRPRIVEIIVSVAAEQLRADVVALFSRRPDGSYRLEAGSGFTQAAIGLELPQGDGFIWRCITERVRSTEVLTVDAWPPEFRTDRPGGDAAHAAMALPIEVGGRVAAVVLVTRVGAEHGFTELDGGIADLLSAQVAIALQNADLHAQVAESAVRDPLTGLLNRRYFDEAVETAFASARRSGAHLSLIVLDLDRFSEVNNEHGHPVGDAMLRRVAQAMTSSVRTGDIVARYGGEEFVVIAPGSSAEDAVGLAERIRAAVAAEARRPFEGLVVPLTISAGVASRLGDEADGRALFRAADSALLAAKRAGRDRVVTV
jgi:diguanylate cyclase (GGDEF)-like protein